jgi:uracil-DNA glycosylase
MFDFKNIDPSWKDFFQKEIEKDYFKKLTIFLKKEYENHNCFPKKEDIFKVFKLTSVNNLKVVIIGQDPYIKKYQANGLAFSVNKNAPLPKSLENIFKELKNDLNIERKNGDLSNWCSQGVMLLNLILTTREMLSNNHRDYGWEKFSENVIKYINQINYPIVFVLWGKSAQLIKEHIDSSKHLILLSSHPSPFSAHLSFFNSKPFSKINHFLIKNKSAPIDWSS